MGLKYEEHGGRKTGMAELFSKNSKIFSLQ
jgi:hypothetical protein